MEEPFEHPLLFSPFPSTISPLRDTVQAHVEEWAQAFHLVTGEVALKRFRAAKFGWLAARTFPQAAHDELLLVADWNVWLFMLDDQCDESGIGREPERLRQVFAAFTHALADPEAPFAPGPLANSLRDVWRRIRERSTAVWQSRFRSDVQNYFDACVWEASNRKRGVFPTVQDYIPMRQFTGGLITDIDLIDLTEHIDLPAEAREHPVIARMATLANNVVCWSNDIVSVSKELQRGDVHNLVLVIQHERECALQEAMSRAGAMHDRQVEEFLELERQVPDWGAPINEDMRKYLGVLRSWMRGNMDWAHETGRYTPTGAGKTSHTLTYLEPIIEASRQKE